MKVAIPLMFICVVLANFCEAHKCIHAEMEKVVKVLMKRKVLKSPEVIKAFCSVDRLHFVDDEATAYSLEANPIGHGATLSGPALHAAALENFYEKFQHKLKACKNGQKDPLQVLDIGSGSGIVMVYIATILENFGCTSAKVFGIEHVPELVSKANDRILDHYYLSSKAVKGKTDSNLIFIGNYVGDGRKGLPDFGPYDYIHCGASFLDQNPQAILDQLKVEGRLHAPIRQPGKQYDFTTNFDKSIDKDGLVKISKKKVFKSHYVDMQDKQKQVSAEGSNEFFKPGEEDMNSYNVIFSDQDKKTVQFIRK